MLLFEQLRFFFTSSRAANDHAGEGGLSPSARDPELEARGREMLCAIGESRLLARLRVNWNSRLRSSAGRAAFQHTLVSLNPRLREHGTNEIDRTFRHELAHLVAQARAGRRRISPHGPEWRQACRDLGIADEQRCHTLPFPIQTQARRFLYRCPECEKQLPRVRRIRRSVACLECCRRHNRGRYQEKFRLQLVRQIRRA